MAKRRKAQVSQPALKGAPSAASTPPDSAPSAEPGAGPSQPANVAIAAGTTTGAAAAAGAAEGATTATTASGVSTKVDWTNYSLLLYVGGNVVATMPLPNQPTSVDVSKTPAVSVRRTLGAFPIRQHSSDRMWDIVVQGMVGIVSRQYPTVESGIQLGSPQLLPSMDILAHFEAFLAAYQTKAAEGRSNYIKAADGAVNPGGVYLVFSDMYRGISYRVELVKFDNGQNAYNTRVNNSMWTLRMQGYAYSFSKESKDSESSNFGVGGTLFGATATSQITAAISEMQQINKDSGVSAWRKKLIAAVVAEAAAGNGTKPGAAFANLSNFMSMGESSDMWKPVGGSTPIPGPLGNIVAALGNPYSTSLLSKDTLKDINRLRLATAQFNEGMRRIQLRLQEANDLAKLPSDMLADVLKSGKAVLDTVDAIKETGYAFYHSTDEISRALQRIPSMVGPAVEAILPAFITGGGTAKLLLSDLNPQYNKTLEANGLGTAFAFAETSPSFKDMSTSLHVVSQGETWPDIALRYYGSSDSWADLASYNGAPDAYSSADGTPLAAGSMVYIPGASTVGQFTAALSNAQSMYGTSLLFDFNTGDLALNVGARSDGSLPEERTGFAKAEGNNNFKQALIHRMLTIRGELQYAQGYGLFPIEPGSAMTSQDMLSSTAELYAQLQEDPRVANVQDTYLDITADKVKAQFSVLGIGGGRVSVIAPV